MAGEIKELNIKWDMFHLEILELLSSFQPQEGHVLQMELIKSKIV